MDNNPQAEIAFDPAQNLYDNYLGVGFILWKINQHFANIFTQFPPSE